MYHFYYRSLYYIYCWKYIWFVFVSVLLLLLLLLLSLADGNVQSHTFWPPVTVELCRAVDVPVHQRPLYSLKKRCPCFIKIWMVWSKTWCVQLLDNRWRRSHTLTCVSLLHTVTQIDWWFFILLKSYTYGYNRTYQTKIIRIHNYFIMYVLVFSIHWLL